MYIESMPVSSTSLSLMKVSKCHKPDGLHPRLIGADEHMTRAVMIKMNSPDLIGI